MSSPILQEPLGTARPHLPMVLQPLKLARTRYSNSWASQGKDSMQPNITNAIIKIFSNFYDPFFVYSSLLTYIPIQVYSPSTSPSPPHHLLPSPPGHSSSISLFRKGQASQRYQANMAYQTRHITSPHIKVGWGNTVGVKASQKQQDSETVSVPSVSGTIETLTIVYVQRA